MSPDQMEEPRVMYCLGLPSTTYTARLVRFAFRVSPPTVMLTVLSGQGMPGHAWIILLLADSFDASGTSLR